MEEIRQTLTAATSHMVADWGKPILERAMKTPIPNKRNKPAKGK